MAKRGMTAEDLYRLQVISGVRIAPDGRHIVFCLHRVERKKEKKYANLWVVPTTGGAPRQFTHGDQLDIEPQWSPDGQSLAFLSNRGDEKQFQLHLIPFGGGEARRVTELHGQFRSLVWSPDGKRLAFLFRKKDQEEIEREKDEQQKKLGRLDRHITRTFYKLDNEGYLPHERWHLWTLEVSSRKTTLLTAGDVCDEADPAWSPDGKLLTFCSNRQPEPDLDPDVIDLYVIAASGGKMRRIDLPVGPKELPAFSPDGKWIAYVSREGKGDWWRNNQLWITTLDGKVTNLTARYDINISTWTSSDVVGMPTMMPPAWSPDGGTLYFQTSEEGNTGLRSITRAGKLSVVLAVRGTIGSFTFDRSSTRLAYLFTDIKNPGEVWTHDLKTTSSRQLTHVNERLLKGIALSQVEEVWFKGAAGNQLQGWIMKPPGFDPKKKYPSILQIHGGPLVQYGHVFTHEFYFLAAQGYVVSFCNPRGGIGYGETHAKAIWRKWGTADYDDVMAWADEISKRPYIDRKHMGVTGGSYGGFMTNWIIGHTDRFQAAVTQRSVSNHISMWGSSDFNWAFQEEIGGRPPWENLEGYWQQSPMKHIGKAKTPTLVIHSEHDHRCDQEQGEQVYVALKKLGVPTELVLFPDESHELSRSGRTDRRIARLNHILRWFDRYLK